MLCFSLPARRTSRATLPAERQCIRLQLTEKESRRNTQNSRSRAKKVSRLTTYDHRLEDTVEFREKSGRKTLSNAERSVSTDGSGSERRERATNETRRNNEPNKTKFQTLICASGHLTRGLRALFLSRITLRRHVYVRLEAVD